MTKIEKDFVISDSSVNSYGFRLLTSGYVISEFQKNPIGYFMHDRDSGILVKWENLKIQGDKVIGRPNINPSHARADQTIKEVNTGYLNAASVGHITVLEYSDDPALKMPGQTGVTVTKWYNRECSLVDIPGNENALSLYDLKGKLMPLNLFAGKQLNASKPDNPEDNLNVDQLLQEAIKNNDITSEQAQLLKEQYKDDPAKLHELLKGFAQMRINFLMSLSWEELDKQSLLPELKEKYLQGFQQKYYTEFGKDHKTVNENKANSNDLESENERLMQFAIKNGDMEPEVAAMMKNNYKNNPEELNKILKAAPQNRVDYLMSLSWDDLDKKGLMEELKKKYLQGFKQKHKEKFGVAHK